MKASTSLLLGIVSLFCAVNAAAAAEQIVSVVNGSAITARELEMAVDELIPQATFHGNVSEERRAEFQDKALQNLIILELQSQDALARGLKPDRKQVKEQMKQVRASFASSKEYKDWLERTWVSDARLQARLEKLSLAREAKAQTVTGPAQITEKDLKSYYEQNISKFREPETVRLRIISTRDEAKARSALEKLSQGGDFGDVAARMSEDDYRIKGGDIGYVHRGRIYPALEDAAFKLQPGDTSGLLSAEGRWFVIKVEDRKPERTLPFDEAKDSLKKELEKKRAIELEQKWMADLRAKSAIEIKIPSNAVSGDKQ